ncbi:MAG: hypothetical protein WC319_03985 [Candidatus Paceibacterota bacterium]|jgi:hypothetical protein
MPEKEIVITSNPFEGAVQQVLAFVRDNGKGPESEMVLENAKRRFCIDEREEQIMQEAYENGKLRIWYYPIQKNLDCLNSQDYPGEPAGVRSE